MKYVSRDCPLCGKWDCDCADILTEEEFEKIKESEDK